MKLSFTLLTLVLLAVTQAQAKPAQVLLIRHAEKPADKDDVHLSSKGQKRARALVGFFTRHASVTEFGPPAAIFAAAPKYEDSSLRAIETVEPLADALRMKVRDEYTSKDSRELVEHVLKRGNYEGKTVLISWSHDDIPKLVKRFGARGGLEWGKDVFDRVWQITFPEGATAKVKDLPQNVLPGDSH